jgi:two-component system, OmpR family, alkaline phosphatase synthesis response regulator PhoP
MARILVVEDNDELAAALRFNLELEGHEVVVAADGPGGLGAARVAAPELVILDLMLPGLDGFRVLKAMRDGGLDMPVLILTARGEEADKVRGLRVGADDYVTKPFGLMELLARVEALLRRRARGAPAPAAARETLRFADMEIDVGARAVRRGGREVALSPKEFELLLALVRRQGAVASRIDLLREVWDYDASVLSRTVDAHVKELRRKLEDDPANPRHILTVWKLGYRAVP